MEWIPTHSTAVLFVVALVPRNIAHPSCVTTQLNSVTFPRKVVKKRRREKLHETKQRSRKVSECDMCYISQLSRSQKATPKLGRWHSSASVEVKWFDFTPSQHTIISCKWKHWRHFKANRRYNSTFSFRNDKKDDNFFPSGISKQIFQSSRNSSFLTQNFHFLSSIFCHTLVTSSFLPTPGAYTPAKSFES